MSNEQLTEVEARILRAVAAKVGRAAVLNFFVEEATMGSIREMGGLSCEMEASRLNLLIAMRERQREEAVR